MARSARFLLPLFLPLLLALLAACGGDDDAGTCERTSDCPAGQTCADGMCVPTGRADAAVDASGEDAPASGDAGGCPSEVLCGSPAVCCGVGQECVEGACVAPCESGVRCDGACCGAEQACVSSACQSLGDPCTDSYDCPEGAFCEPTLGRCLPQFDPVECQVVPEFESFAPAEEWSANSFEEFPDYARSTVMPVVVDLDGDRVPEVVASFFWSGAGSGPGECRGVLRVLDGRTGAPVWSLEDAFGSQVSACPTHAAADLDGDGTPEIVTLRHDGRLVALRADGSMFWLSTRTDGGAFSVGTWLTYANAAIAIGDLVPGGGPEIAVGGVVFDSAGVHLWSTPAAIAEGENNGYNGGLPLIADVNVDGQPDLVTGRSAWNHDGTLLWTAEGSDGYPAVGNFDDDPQAEVVRVSFGAVSLLDGVDGNVQWGPVAVPGGGRGGPPTIADFDGDGQPEIGVAGATNYVVFDPTGDADILWQRPTQDASSNATGSAVFDFEGDGAAEVVYGDECYVRAYRGSTGEELFALPNPSGTQHEYPVTADVDADGNTEILFVANGVAGAAEFRGCESNPGWDAAGRFGVFVFGDSADRWVRTRRVWNQHTYHVTHTTSTGSVVAPEPNNWQVSGLNNFRQNTQGEGVFNAPDLSVSLSVSLSMCPSLVLRARVTNVGSLGVPAGVPVTFRAGPLDAPGEVVATGVTDAALLPGASVIVEAVVEVEGDGPFSFVAEVDRDADGGEVVLECDEDDNRAGIDGADCGFLI